MKHAIVALAIALLLPAGAAGQSADATLTGTIRIRRGLWSPASPLRPETSGPTKHEAPSRAPRGSTA